MMEYLKKMGIATGIHFPTPIHLVPAFSNLPYKKGDFSISERVSKEIISLPCYPELKLQEVKYVCQVIKKFFKNQ